MSNMNFPPDFLERCRAENFQMKIRATEIIDSIFKFFMEEFHNRGLSFPVSSSDGSPPIFPPMPMWDLPPAVPVPVSLCAAVPDKESLQSPPLGNNESGATTNSGSQSLSVDSPLLSIGTATSTPLAQIFATNSQLSPPAKSQPADLSIPSNESTVTPVISTTTSSTVSNLALSQQSVPSASSVASSDAVAASQLTEENLPKSTSQNQQPPCKRKKSPKSVTKRNVNDIEVITLESDCDDNSTTNQPQTSKAPCKKQQIAPKEQNGEIQVTKKQKTDSNGSTDSLTQLNPASFGALLSTVKPIAKPSSTNASANQSSSATDIANQSKVSTPSSQTNESSTSNQTELDGKSQSEWKGAKHKFGQWIAVGSISESSGDKLAPNSSSNPSTSSAKEKHNTDETPERYKQLFNTLSVSCLVNKCCKTFPNTDRWAQHMKDAHKIQAYRCPLHICNKSFPDAKSLDDHQNIDHRDVKLWQCYGCDERFALAHSLSRHLFLEHFSGKFACTQSGCRFTSKYRVTMVRHYNAFHQKASSSDSDSCPDDCGKHVHHCRRPRRSLSSQRDRSSSSSSRARSKEMNTSSSNTSAEWTSSEIDFNFTEDENIYTIVYRTCIAAGCNDSFFWTKSEFDDHLNGHGMAAQRCPLGGCERSFKTSQAITHHLRTEHGHRRHWNCDDCANAKFSSPVLLARHLFFEHHKGKFRCVKDDCNFEGSLRFQMFEHNFEAHEGLEKDSDAQSTLPKPKDSDSSLAMNSKLKYIISSLKCSLNNCAEFFITNDDFVKHLKDSHQLLPYLCPVLQCGQSFDTMKQLHEHGGQNHKTMKELQCPVCNLEFVTFSTMQVHVYQYHYEGQFKCTWKNCDKFAKYRGHIIDHYDQKHLERFAEAT